jgi:choline-sulfatase
MARNLLVLCFDDLNDWLGCLGGHPQVKTPHIDALARRGTLFTNAHCQAPLCTPSRTSLLTGKRPTTTGVYCLQPWIRSVPGFEKVVTLPQHLASHGYRTMATGKVFHDGQGQNEWNGPTFVGGYKNVPKKKLVQPPADPNPLMDWGVWPERDEDHDDTRIAEWAEARLLEKSDQPWMLSVGFRNPHVPCYASQKWFDLYPEETLQLPACLSRDRDDTPEFAWNLHWRLPEPRRAWLEKNGQWKNLVRSYLASISFVDSLVGRVLRALERSGQAQNTLIALHSDHGWHLGEKGISGKNSLWDESTHVPLLFAGPGVRRGRCSQPVELLDLFPTLCELAGLPLPEGGLDGHSLVPQLQNPRAVRPWPAITTHNPGSHAIRAEHWRYIRYADGSEELYDTRKDPNEWTNLAARPELTSIKAELSRWLPQNERPHAPGSSTRILTRDPGGEWLWEGRPIRESERQF